VCVYIYIYIVSLSSSVSSLYHAAPFLSLSLSVTPLTSSPDCEDRMHDLYAEGGRDVIMSHETSFKLGGCGDLKTQMMSDRMNGALWHSHGYRIYARAWHYPNSSTRHAYLAPSEWIQRNRGPQERPHCARLVLQRKQRGPRSWAYDIAHVQCRPRSRVYRIAHKKCGPRSRVCNIAHVHGPLPKVGET
jgi:hypothetical protein